jgi:hypothetical protein
MGTSILKLLKEGFPKQTKLFLDMMQVSDGIKWKSINFNEIKSLLILHAQLIFASGAVLFIEAFISDYISIYNFLRSIVQK